MQAAREHLGPPALTLLLDRQRIVAAGRDMAPPPAERAFLAWFARRAAAGAPSLPCPEDGVPEPAFRDAYLRECRRVAGSLGVDERTRRRCRDGMSKADVEEHKSKLKRVLVEALGAAPLPSIVHGSGRHPMRCGLALPPAAITFDDVRVVHGFGTWTLASGARSSEGAA